jgi:hypothetical protein
VSTLGAVKKYHQIFQGLAMAGSAGWLKKCVPSKWSEAFFMVSVLSAEVDNTTKAKLTSLEIIFIIQLGCNQATIISDRRLLCFMITAMSGLLTSHLLQTRIDIALLSCAMNKVKIL